MTSATSEKHKAEPRETSTAKRQKGGGASKGKRSTSKPKRKVSAARKQKPYEGRIYLGRDPETGKQRFEYVGHFARKRERDQAVAKAKIERGHTARAELPTVDEYGPRYLRDYKRRNKYSSWVSTRERLQPFFRDFAGRRLDIERGEAKDWTFGEGRWADQGPQRSGTLQAVVTMINYGIEEDDLPLPKGNAFRGLGRRTKGRSEEPPPTPDEFERLLDGCEALSDYGPRFRALMLFAAYTLLRPSELYVLKWTDLDFEAKRIRKGRRLYRGNVDDPKYGKATIALTWPARDAIADLPRDSEYVFLSKTGKRLSQTTLSGYWAQVKARAGLDFDFYHATKHYGVHFLWTKLELPRRAIAAQAGWSISTIDKMLSIYGHGEVGALEEVDAAFERAEPSLIPGSSNAAGTDLGQGAVEPDHAERVAVAP